MFFARFSLLLLFVGLATSAIAADKHPTSISTTPTANASEPATNGSDVSEQRPFWMYRMEPIIASLQPNGPGRIPLPRLRGRSLADLNGNVCYTMRTYKIKPTERIQEGESVNGGYSECEMASNFEIHSAVAHKKEPAKVK